MMGFATAISKVVSADAMKKAIEVSVPPATIDLNLKAFQKGYDYGATLAG
jgi:2-oxoglutarate ferredoxin oxidoreductase subunit gamma